MSVTRQTPSTILPPHRAAELSTILAGLCERYSAYLGLIGSQREAIRAADPTALARIHEVQGATLQAIASLDERRQVLVNAVSDTGLWKGRTPITLTELSEFAPESERKHLKDAAQTLRAVMERCRDEQATIRAAAVSLAAHIEGMMRQIARTISHAGTYGRRGIVDTSTTVVTALDLRS